MVMRCSTSWDTGRSSIKCQWLPEACELETAGTIRGRCSGFFSFKLWQYQQSWTFENLKAGRLCSNLELSTSPQIPQGFHQASALVREGREEGWSRTSFRPEEKWEERAQGAGQALLVLRENGASTTSTALPAHFMAQCQSAHSSSRNFLDSLSAVELSPYSYSLW